MSAIDFFDEKEIEEPFDERFEVKTLATVKMNFNGNDIKVYNEIPKTNIGKGCLFLRYKEISLGYEK